MLETEIWNHRDYRSYLNAWIKAQPRSGYGQSNQMALHLNTSRTLISQVLRGVRDLTMEQGYELAIFLELSGAETEYFMSLLNVARAGTASLRTYFNDGARKLRDKSQRIAERVGSPAVDEKVQREFYSDYKYTAVRMATEHPALNDANTIANALGIDLPKTREIVDFLLANNLIVKKNDQLTIGPAATHIGNDNPLVVNHHRNWRLRSMDTMSGRNSEHLFFTAPMAISKDDEAWLKQKLLTLIEELTKRAKDTKAESLTTLNIDLFSFAKLKQT
jgi:uncharacterized protein (TIGR02147 family)